MLDWDRFPLESENIFQASQALDKLLGVWHDLKDEHANTEAICALVLDSIGRLRELAKEAQFASRLSAINAQLDSLELHFTKVYPSTSDTTLARDTIWAVYTKLDRDFDTWAI